MSRALTAILALALAGGVSALPVPGPIGADSRAAAADCSWQRHSKRILKQVKRDGRLRRVVRRRHWWSCVPLAAAPGAGAPSPSPLPAPPSPAPQAEPEPAVARLSVKALEFSYTLSRPTLAPGEVIVELNNQGEDPHNLNLQLEGGEGPPLAVPEAGPLERRVARFTLPAGDYRLWCSLPQHDEWGMNASLTVGGG